MADNAIDKLFEEMCAAEREEAEANKAVADLEQQRVEARNRVRKAEQRRDLLDRTLKKHIFDKLPIIQAKMQAHEEQAEDLETESRNQGGAWGALTSGTISANHIRVGSIATSLIRPDSITSGPKQP